MIEKPKLIDPENHIYSASAEVEGVFDMGATDKKSNSVKFELMPHDSSVFKLKEPADDISCKLAPTDRQKLKGRAVHCLDSLKHGKDQPEKLAISVKFLSYLIPKLIDILPEETITQLKEHEEYLTKTKTRCPWS